jgi:hypothetical protein
MSWRGTCLSLSLSTPALYLGEETWMGGEVCVSILTLSTSIYRPRHWRENSLGTWESTIGPTTEHHVEADGDPWQGRFGRSKGSTDQGPPRLTLCFLPVTDMWSLMLVPGAHAVWRRFARVVGPWILVSDTWRHLIHQGVLLLDWWGVMDMAFCVPAHRHVAWCGSHRTNDIVWSYIVHISFIQAPKYTNDISISIISTRPSQWCRPIWNLRLFMMIPYLFHWFACSQLYHFICILMCFATKDRNTNTCGTCQYKDLF